MKLSAPDPNLLAPGPQFLPFSLPDIGEEEIAEVLDTLRSGWITTGPKARRFEAEFADYLDTGLQALAVSSATAGLHLALEAAGVGPGDEVIVPTMTFTATAEVVRYLGAHPVLVDIDPGTLNIDIEAMRAALSPHTRAVMPVHFAGLPCDMDPIIALAHAHGVAVIEDAAHAFPARYGGRLIGSLDSDATVFSFYANKTMTTGEGGMLVTRHPSIAARARVMRLHGIRNDAFDRYVSKVPAWFYEVVAPGYKYNMSDVAASIGIQQLHKIDAFLRRRTELAWTYHEALADLPLTLPPAAPAGDTHAWHLYPVRLQAHAAIDRDELIRKLYERGIGASVHFIPLHRHPYWHDTYGLDDGRFPHADQAYRAILSLPLYTRMQEADQRRVIEALAELL